MIRSLALIASLVCAGPSLGHAQADKALMAKATSNPEWERLRAPMTPLASATHMTAKAHDLLSDTDG